MSKRKFPNLMEAIANGRGVERSFCCDVHEDASPSASVNVELGVWTCYACGAGGKVGTGKTSDTVKSAVEKLQSSQPPHVFDDAWLDFFDASGPSPYWAGRFSVRTATAYRCGTHPFTGNPTYPVLSPHGQVWGVVERTDGPLKYLYPKGVSVGKTLFGFRKGRFHSVIVCEGAGDVMAFHAAGVPKGVLLVGTYGAGVNAPQAALIRSLSVPQVIMAYDNDEAGRTAANRQYDFGVSRVRIVEWPEGVKDPGEAPLDLLRKEMQ